MLDFTFVLREHRYRYSTGAGARKSWAQLSARSRTATEDFSQKFHMRSQKAHTIDVPTISPATYPLQARRFVNGHGATSFLGHLPNMQPIMIDAIAGHICVQNEQTPKFCLSMPPYCSNRFHTMDSSESRMAQLQREKRAFKTQFHLDVSGGASWDEALKRRATQLHWNTSQLDNAQAELIRLERAIIAEKSELRKFLDKEHSLQQYNVWLAGFGIEEQPSLTAARKELKRIHINIYDLKAELYSRRHPSIRALAAYTRKHGLVFPLKTAKGSVVKVFLRPLHLGGGHW